MKTFRSLSINCKDAENPEFTLMLCNSCNSCGILETLIHIKKPDGSINKIKTSKDSTLNTLLLHFFSLVKLDEFNINDSDFDYFYQSLIEAIFYYTCADIGYHHAYSEIKLKSMSIESEY